MDGEKNVAKDFLSIADWLFHDVQLSMTQRIYKLDGRLRGRMANGPSCVWWNAARIQFQLINLLIEMWVSACSVL